MAMNLAANLAEKVSGSGNNATVTTGVSNPSVDLEKYADTSVPIKAVTWQGKNSVAISKPLPALAHSHQF
jgi:hypothetical protein